MKQFIITLLLTTFFIFYSINLYAQECSRPIIFPLISKPLNDPDGEYANYNWKSPVGQNQAVYKSYRIRKNSSKNLTKKSFHASRDLYTDVYNDMGGNYNLLRSKNSVVAMADGEVIMSGSFYAGTNVVAVKHTTCDGRSFIIRYGEMDPSTIKVKTGDKVKQGQVLGKPGFLSKRDKYGNIVPIDVIADKVVFMLHLEYFTDSTSNATFSKAFSNNRFDRRSDIADSLPILEEGFRISFGK